MSYGMFVTALLDKQDEFESYGIFLNSQHATCQW